MPPTERRRNGDFYDRQEDGRQGRQKTDPGGIRGHHPPPPPCLPRRPQMPRLNRAAQFAPFAALTGYGDEILEAGRATEQKPELSDSRQDELDRRLRLLTAACRHSGNLLPEETQRVPARTAGRPLRSR